MIQDSTDARIIQKTPRTEGLVGTTGNSQPQRLVTTSCRQKQPCHSLWGDISDMRECSNDALVE